MVPTAPCPPPQARAQRGDELAEKPWGPSWDGGTGPESRAGLTADLAT